MNNDNKNQAFDFDFDEPSYLRVRLDKLRPSKWDPRHGEGDVDDLVESFKDTEQHHNIIIRSIAGTDEFEIVTGNRRVRAARAIGWTHIDAKVVMVDDRKAKIIAIQENLHRRELTDAPKQAAYLAELLRLEGKTQIEAIRVVADLTKTSERTARRDVNIGTKGTPKLQEAHRHQLVGKAEADKIAGLPPEQQDAEIDRIVKERQERIAEDDKQDDPAIAISTAISLINEAHRILRPLARNFPTIKQLQGLWEVHRPMEEFIHDLYKEVGDKDLDEKAAARLAASTAP